MPKNLFDWICGIILISLVGSIFACSQLAKREVEPMLREEEADEAYATGVLATMECMQSFLDTQGHVVRGGEMAQYLLECTKASSRRPTRKKKEFFL